MMRESHTPYSSLSIVPSQPLPNYIRTHRKRNFLSQRDVAFLLGVRSGAKVSRYENFARTPQLAVAFALQVIFLESASTIFAGTYQTTRLAVQARAKRLLARLAASPHAPRSRGHAIKVAMLRAIVNDKPTSERRNRP